MASEGFAEQINALCDVSIIWGIREVCTGHRSWSDGSELPVYRCQKRLRLHTTAIGIHSKKDWSEWHTPSGRDTSLPHLQQQRTSLTDRYKRKDYSSKGEIYRLLMPSTQPPNQVVIIVWPVCCYIRPDVFVLISIVLHSCCSGTRRENPMSRRELGTEILHLKTRYQPISRWWWYTE